MVAYLVRDKIVEKGSAEWENLLPSLHRTSDRPSCLCRPEGIPMYVICLDGRYYIKRMPNTGGDHDPGCSSYEPPAELSGLGQVLGTAIVEDAEIGTTALRLQFSMTKSTGRSIPVPGECTDDSVKTDGNKLSLRGLLHFLWEEAGFHKWSPAMVGKRNWGVLRKYLLQAAQHKLTKRSELSSLLYVPEPFTVERKDAIAQRRTTQLLRVAAGFGQSSSRKLMLLIAEVKAIAPSRGGYRLIAKHLNDFHFLMNSDLHQRLMRRFDLELSLHESVEGSHLVTIATFGVNKAGVATIEEMGLMVTTDNWIPFDSLPEKNLIDSLSHDKRRFIKGLRYNLHSSSPLATVVVTDTELPTAMYVHPPGASAEYLFALEELIENSKMASWIWHPDQGAMPPLPAVATKVFTQNNQMVRVPRHAG